MSNSYIFNTHSTLKLKENAGICNRKVIRGRRQFSITLSSKCDRKTTIFNLPSGGGLDHTVPGRLALVAMSRTHQQVLHLYHSFPFKFNTESQHLQGFLTALALIPEHSI